MIRTCKLSLALLLSSALVGPAMAYDPYPLTSVTGDISIPGPGPRAVAVLPSINTNIGVCGDSTHVSQLTLNAKGQVTGCVGVAISTTGTGGSSTTAVTAAPGDVSTLIANTQFVSQSRSVYRMVDFGAKCDNTSHPVGTELGLTTIAQIANYSKDGVTHPWAFIANGHFGYATHMNALADRPSGSSYITVISGQGIPAGASIATPNGYINTTLSSVTKQAAVTAVIASGGASGTNTITMTSTSGLWAGEIFPSVVGVPQNNAIVSIAGNVITVAKNFTAQVTGPAGSSSIVFPAIGVLQLASPLTGAIKGRLTGGETASTSSLLRITAPLTDAQAQYAERDWLALEGGLEAAKTHNAQTRGTTVEVPDGQCMMDNVNNLGSGIGTLELPPSSDNLVYALGNPVDITGVNVLASQLRWPADLGYNRMGIVAGYPSDDWVNSGGRFGYNFYYGRISNLTMAGPANGTRNVGQVAAWMNGIADGPRRNLDHLQISDFYANIAQTGDLEEINDVEAQPGAIGLLIDDGNPALHGKLVMNRLRMSLNTIAAIEVSKNGQLNASMEKPDLSAVPYAILGEAGVPDSFGEPTPGTMINELHMQNPSFEQLGNGAIVDDNVTTADGLNRGTMLRDFGPTVLNQPVFGYNTANSMTTEGRGLYQYFSAKSAQNLQLLDLPPNALSVSPSMTSVINLAAGLGYIGGGMRITGDLGVLAQTGVSFMSGAISAYGAPFWKDIALEYPGIWHGHEELIPAANPLALVPGMVIEQSNTAGGQISTTGAAGVLGITQQTNAQAGGDIVPLATLGEAVSVATSGTVSPGTWLKKGPGGCAVPATGPTDGVPVGYVVGFSSGTTSFGGNTYTVYPVHLTFGGM